MYEVWEYDLSKEYDEGYIMCEKLTYEQAKTIVRIAPEHLLRVIAKSE
jgi:hypothetical protein